MANPRQKRKLRSSINKVAKKPKSKKKVLNHPVIAANWDRTQTLAQNYKRLGLARQLNKSTGGTEKKASDVGRDEGGDWKKQNDDGMAIDGGRMDRSTLKEAPVIRNEDGKIVQVMDDGTMRPNPLNDPLNELDSDSDESSAMGQTDQHGNAHSSTNQKPSQATNGVVAQLEEQASRPSAKYKRKQSEVESGFIGELVEKYGDDYKAMARDMKINYMQRSQGDLKKRVKRWREAGGGG